MAPPGWKCQDHTFAEDHDDDNDGVADWHDSCRVGEWEWSSNASTDHDSDGCQDSSEDLDDDGDGVADDMDGCARGPSDGSPITPATTTRTAAWTTGRGSGPPGLPGAGRSRGRGETYLYGSDCRNVTVGGDHLRGQDTADI